jgi:hypothetical protein
MDIHFLLPEDTFTSYHNTFDATLTVKQLEALKIIMSLAKRHHLRVDLNPGDLVFINNLSMLHAREKFKDSALQKRHHVRVWLRNDELGWKIPEHLESPWQDVFASTQLTDDLYPIYPVPVHVPPIYALGPGGADDLC